MSPADGSLPVNPKSTRAVRSNIRQLQKGERVVQTGNIMRVLDQNDVVMHEATLSAEVPDLRSGWVASAGWTNTSANLITSMTTTWTVPRSPTTTSGQIIFIFDGLQNSSRILQPVLQWGGDSSDSGSGDYWVIASWNAGSQSDPFYLSPSVIRVNPGDQLVGSMIYTGSTKDASGVTHYNYTSSFVGFPGTELSFSTTEALYNPVETLEVYGITQCSDYPATNLMAMRDIDIAVQGASVTLSASAPIAGDCGEKAVVIAPSGNQGEVLIYFRGPTAWRVNDLSVAAQAPAAAGSPTSYTWDKDGTEHVVYAGVDGDVHELWFNGAWHHNNLTVAAGGAPSPAGDLFGYTWSVDGTEHVVYRGGDGHIHELWFNGAWHLNDITAAAGAPLAAGDPVAHTYASDKTEHVIYRGADGHIHELWFNGVWRHNDLTVASGAPAVAPGDPCSYVYPKDNTQHVAYIGQNGHVYELWFNGAWHCNDLTVAAKALANAVVGSRPTGYVYATDATEHVVYRCNDGSIEELWFNGTWSANLISAAGGGSPRAASDPVGYTWSRDQTEHVVYRGVEGDIHELWFNGVWNYNDLTRAVSPTAPTSTGKPAGYEWTKDGTEHVVYRSATGDMIELWL
jgi:hypothetical protein